jgi:uncharacterized protein
MSEGSDPEMQRAFENARSTFRYFWREVALEQRRIVPALDLACVKAPFADESQKEDHAGTPEAEQMWIEQVDFDGRFVSGVLLNDPFRLKTMKKGDAIRLPLDQISDWFTRSAARCSAPTQSTCCAPAWSRRSAKSTIRHGG